jgi:hypothetical protein
VLSGDRRVVSTRQGALLILAARMGTFRVIAVQGGFPGVFLL